MLSRSHKIKLIKITTLNKIFFYVLFFFCSSFWLNFIFATFCNAENYQIEIKNLEIYNSSSSPSQVKKSPLVLSLFQEKVLGLNLFYENKSMKMTKNKPLTFPAFIKIINGKNQKYYLYLLGHYNSKNFDKNYNFPQFLGDSGECSSLFSSCSWVVNSTTGFAFRINKPLHPLFDKPHFYQKVPLVNFKDDYLLLTPDISFETDILNLEYKINLSPQNPSSLSSLTLNYLLLPAI